MPDTHITTDPADIDEAIALAAWVREYSDTFGLSYHANDPTRMRPYCNVPSLGIGGGRVNLIATEEASDARWAAAHAALPEDYHHSVLHTVDVTLTSPTSALVTVDCSRYRLNGDPYVRFKASYVLAKGDDGWRIAVWLGHAR